MITNSAHRKQCEILNQCIHNNVLPHAMLFSGAEGLGKATIAKDLAAQLVGKNHIHDASLYYQCIQKTDKKEITIDAIRNLKKTFKNKALNDKPRIVLIDSIDDLNVNATNALLKLLEEPPHNTHLLLISHRPYGLLPTIKSRTIELKFHGLSLVDFANALQDKVGNEDIDLLYVLSDGAPGRALYIMEQDGVKYYQELCKLLQSVPQFNWHEAHNFIDQVTKDEQSYRLCTELMLKLLGRVAKMSAALVLEHTAFAPLVEYRSLEHWAEIWEQLAKHFRGSFELNLEKKQTLLSAFSLLTVQ
jgi:DNA polymerase III subunit delta'